MMTRKNLRLLSYVRVSDVRGREGPGFISPDEQREKCQAFASAMGHTIVDEGMELDRSGGDMGRPVFNALLERIEAGEADGMIVAKLNRFARSNVGAWQALERIKAAGGELLSVEENIDTSTATGRFLRDFMLIAANWERERIGEQWLSARTRAVARGIHVSRHVPAGYERTAKNDPRGDRILVPHSHHGKTMTNAFAMAARGDSYGRIATYLNNRGLPVGGKDGVWNAGRIRRLLANRVYLGEARSGEGNVNPQAHEPLVSEVTWNLAQRRPVTPPLTEKAETLLAGLCRCASCSFSMRSQQARQGVVAHYRCVKYSLHGKCPGPSTISMDRLDEYVLEQFLARAGATGTPAEAQDTEAVEAAIAAEQSYRAMLLDTDLRRQIGDTDHAQLVAKLHKEWQHLEGQVRPVRQSVTDGANLGDLVAELRRQEKVGDLRDLLAAEIQAVFIRPAKSRSKTLPVADRVRIVWQDEEPLELPRRGKRFEPRAFAWA